MRDGVFTHKASEKDPNKILLIPKCTQNWEGSRKPKRKTGTSENKSPTRMGMGENYYEKTNPSRMGSEGEINVREESFS